MQSLLESLLNEPAFTSTVKYKMQEYIPNVKILHKDESHSYFYCIIKGDIRILMHNTTDETPIKPSVAELHMGDFFGEFALFQNSPACADAVTISDSTLLEIEINSFREFLDRNRETAYLVFDLIIANLIKRIHYGNNAILHLLHWGLKAHNINDHLK